MPEPITFNEAHSKLIQHFPFDPELVFKLCEAIVKLNKRHPHTLVELDVSRDFVHNHRVYIRLTGLHPCKCILDIETSEINPDV